MIRHPRAATIIVAGQTSMQIAHCVAAGLRAPHAGIGADAAVFVHLGMLAAFLPAGFAGRGTGLEDRADHRDVRTRAPACDGSRGGADVGAIEVEADALPKLFDLILCQAGIGARGACLGAAVAFLDTAQQGVCRVALDMRVACNHLVDVHVGLLRMNGTQKRQRAVNIPGRRMFRTLGSCGATGRRPCLRSLRLGNRDDDGIGRTTLCF